MRVLLLVLVVLGASPVLAQVDPTSEKRTSIAFVEQAPVVDGILDDEIWKQAVLVDDFHQVRPTEYAEATQRTEVRLIFDEDYLYVGAKLFEDDPSVINGKVLMQGARLRTDDRFGVILDPFLNKRSGYWFMVNSNSIRREAIFKGEQSDWNWQGIWYAESTVTDFGWSVEVAIPFKTLSFTENSDWGLNFIRERVRENEQISWSSRNRNYSPSVAGTVSGIRDVSQGNGLDIVPSISVQTIDDKVGDESDTNTEPSLDIYYKFTPSLNGSLTFNTDFSATEVDNRQVDLSRFSQFFPEKRQFFLKEAEIFEFGGIGGDGGQGGAGNRAVSRPDRENGRPFFSRRIGLSDTGEPVGLEVGARLTGRAGIWNLGVLGIRQEEFEDVDATNIFVGRLTVNVLSESSAGIIVTSGDPQSNLSNELVGADFTYRNSTLPGGTRLEANAWYQQSETEGVSGDDAAFGFSVSYPSQTGWRGGLFAKEIQENFNPAVGFVGRSDVRQVGSELSYTKRFTDRWVDHIVSGVHFQRVTYIDGGLQSQRIVVRALQVQNWIDDQFEILHNIQDENLIEDFEISDGVVIPAGEYSFSNNEISIGTSNSRVANVNFGIRDGDFFTGTIRGYEAAVSWRPSRHFSGSLSYVVDFVDLPEGEFDNRLTRADLRIAFTSELSWVNLIQFDNVSNDLGIDSRFRWVPEPGRNYYLVLSYNMNRSEFDDRWSTTRTGLTAKLDHTFRF